jgi:hypothetical protein
MTIKSAFDFSATKSPGNKRKQDGFHSFFAKIYFEKYCLSYLSYDY